MPYRNCPLNKINTKCFRTQSPPDLFIGVDADTHFCDGKELSYVLAVARDGYAVTFTLAELDPAFRDSTVIVADRRDGGPMASPLGPIRIIAAGDKKSPVYTYA